MIVSLPKWLWTVLEFIGVTEPDPVPASPAPPRRSMEPGSLLDEVCAWVRGGSYLPDEARLTDAVMAEDARLLAEAFTGEAGRRRLMVFARMTVLRPPVDHSLPAGPSQAYAQLRQGQDSIFAGLVRYLDLHEANLRNKTDDRSNHPADPDAAGWSAPSGGSSGDGSDERFSDAGSWDPAGAIAGR